MKNYQFEEITSSLSIIIALLAYNFKVDWLFYIFAVKSVIDVYCSLKTSYIEAKELLKNKENKL